MTVKGKINRKFISALLASIVLNISAGIPNVVNAENTHTLDTQDSEKIEPEVCFFTKKQIIEDIDYVLDTIKVRYPGWRLNTNG